MAKTPKTSTKPNSKKSQEVKKVLSVTPTYKKGGSKKKGC